MFFSNRPKDEQLSGLRRVGWVGYPSKVSPSADVSSTAEDFETEAAGAPNGPETEGAAVENHHDSYRWIFGCFCLVVAHMFHVQPYVERIVSIHS